MMACSHSHASTMKASTTQWRENPHVSAPIHLLASIGQVEYIGFSLPSLHQKRVCIFLLPRSRDPIIILNINILAYSYYPTDSFFN
ncbi:hypothetical protein V6Z12_A11G188500 [Gossypium hirsutum]